MNATIKTVLAVALITSIMLFGAVKFGYTLKQERDSKQQSDSLKTVYANQAYKRDCMTYLKDSVQYEVLQVELILESDKLYK